MLALVNDLFDNESSPHSFYHCVHAHLPCNFIKKKGRKQFDHKWISNRELTFDEETGIWWLVFIPDEGMYCVLCRLHQTQSTKNKLQKSYGLEPAVRMQSDALQEHARSTRHRNSVEAEMIQRVSVFQRKLDERKNCNEEILYGGFTALYWLIKHGVVYRNFSSLLDMIRHGLEKLEHFQHQSNWSARGMVLTMAQFIKNNFLEEARKANLYGLMVDDVTDVSVK